MFRRFPDLLLRLCLLPQRMWLLPSWSLLCMLFPSSRGVVRSRTTSLGSILRGTLGGSTMYLIPSSSTLLQSLIMSCRDLSTRIFLLNRHPPDPLQVINNMRGRVEHAMQIPEVVSNPLFFSILEGLWIDYSVFDNQQVPRRRSRSHSPQKQQLCLVFMTFFFLFVVFFSIVWLYDIYICAVAPLYDI